jgi:hypothetical protein
MNKLTRRAFLIPAGVTTATAMLSGAGLGRSASSVERWMDGWMFATRQPEGALYVGRFRDPIYFLAKPIAWKPDDAASKLPPVSVPTGFVTDFASIPRIFWSVLRPDGEYAYAAVIHDYLYWEQTTSREAADDTFREAMKDFHIDAATAFVIYKAVRLGGNSAWLNNGRLKAKGEKRVLKRLPDDPRVRWEDWKKQPDVFN